MAYVEQTDLEGLIPAEYLSEGLDDTGDENADTSAVWAQIAQSVQDEIDGRVGGRYAVPFSTPAPAAIKAAAKILALWMVYKRRGVSGDSNPWESQAQSWLKKLDGIGAGDIPLTPDTVSAKPQGSVIVEDSKSYRESQLLMV